ncbi:hypothetical protein BH11PLA2_BH11PLA2_11310 [soil metagenome]
MPRSYSRELADRFKGNRRYFRVWNSFERNKIHLCHLAIIGVVVWGAFLFYGGSRGDYHVSHGPVANVHAAWDQKCDTCHKPQGLGDGRLLDAHARWHDFTCEKCHAGPQHHDNLKPEFHHETTCYQCHHDHNGRTFSLVKLSDNHCTRCHQDIEKYMKVVPETSVKKVDNITNFVQDHPKIRPIEVQPHARHLKFSHSIHLTPGMILAKSPDGKPPANAWTLADIEKVAPGRAAEFKPYAERGTNQILLNCQACHQAASSGKTFQPIKYEQHCAACHPNVVPNIVTSAESVLKPFPVPHGQQPDKYVGILEAELSRLLQDKHTDLVKTPVTKEPAPAVVQFSSEVKTKAQSAMHTLFDTKNDHCAKCHDYPAGTKPDAIPASIVPPGIPTVWMKFAKFDHTAHRVADCASCHPNAKSMLGTKEHEIDKSPVDILGIASCKECHAPQRTVGGKITGGVRHACTDCHDYHQVDHPATRLQDALNPKKSMGSFESFLNGKGRE